MRPWKSKFPFFVNFALLVTFLVLLTSRQGQGCECPSCHYSSATENCQCCVFRQLGKRGGDDPETTFTSDLPRPFNLDLWKQLSRLANDDDDDDVTSPKNGALLGDDDWLANPSTTTRRLMFKRYDVMPGSDEAVTSNQPRYVIESKARVGGGRVNRRGSFDPERRLLRMQYGLTKRGDFVNDKNGFGGDDGDDDDDDDDDVDDDMLSYN